MLNELLQNADDAGASVVRLVLEGDDVQHGTASLWPLLQEHVDGGGGGRGGVPWQGPALYWCSPPSLYILWLRTALSH